MPRGQATTQVQIEEIKRLSMEAYTQIDIAHRTGVSVFTVRRIQQENGIKASNRWHFGENPLMDKPYAKPATKKPVAPKEVEEELPPTPATSNKWVTVSQRAIKLTGARTGFKYSIEFDDTFLTIDPGYDEPVKIDLKDIVPLGNELLAVADELMGMKSSISKI